VCAAAEGTRVGIDLERVRPMDLSRLAPAILSSGERRHLYGVPRESRAAEFIRCWTRKEAVVKASGIGVEAALGEIDVDPGQKRSRVTHKAPGCEFDTWWVSDLNARSGLYSAIAVPSSADRSSQEDFQC
jgi:4'-phosphopantetheinyl transferase